MRWYYWNKRLGKSTILKLLPVYGSYSRNRNRQMEEFQLFWNWEPDFNRNILVMENIFLNGTMLGFSEEEINARLDEILSFTQILVILSISR